MPNAVLEPPRPPVGDAEEDQAPKPAAKQPLLGEEPRNRIVTIVIVAVVAVAIGVLLITHKPGAKKTTLPLQSAAVPAAPVQQPSSGNPQPATQEPQTAQANLPTEQTQQQPPSLAQPIVSPEAIQASAANPAAGGAQATQLGSIGQFNEPQPSSNGQWPAPTDGADTTQNREAYDKQVTQPSLVFVLDKPATAGNAAVGPSVIPPPEITNFGYEPGYHIATHLESVATTATRAPVIASVDYDYKRNGVTLIPAGSKVIGQISQASATGIVELRFSSIHMPDGEDIPISAVGLNEQMGPIKGIVTGRHRGRQFLATALGGLGETTAMFAGNNMSAAFSESDMVRQQAAQNIGQAADSQVQQLSVSEHLVVTVQAGSAVEVTFVAPSKKPAETANRRQP
jgi:hypothetical protein